MEKRKKFMHTQPYKNPLVEIATQSSSFYISKYPVTFREYLMFINNKNILTDERKYITNGGYSRVNIFNKENKVFINESGHYEVSKEYLDTPVTGITHKGAVEFATYSGGRLITSGEWNILYQHLAGFYFSKKQLINEGDKIGDTVPVYACPVDPFGLSGVLGNVRIWGESTSLSTAKTYGVGFNKSLAKSANMSEIIRMKGFGSRSVGLRVIKEGV